jgi:hypothetical protein
MFALVLLGGAGVVVIEARVGEEPNHAALGREISARLNAVPSATVSARISETSSPLSREGRVEPILEADRLVEKGKDAYLEGRFAEAIEQLERARGLMTHALESIEEERQAADALFRAELYLAFTLRAQGSGSLGRARDVMRDAIRSFPNLEPPTSEYGPENVRFYREVKDELERGAMGRIRVSTVGQPANVYLNGRLVGVTPLDLGRVYVGPYRMHLRRGDTSSRIHPIEVKSGTNEIVIDADFDAAIREEGTPVFVYSTPALRAELAWRHAARLADVVGVRSVVVYWISDSTATLAVVDRDGEVRTTSASTSEAPNAAVALAAGRIGVVVRTKQVTPHRRVWTWIVGGVAIGALTVAVILGNEFQSDLDTLNQKYPNGTVTDPRDLSLRDDARTKGDAANILYGVAGAAAIGGILLYYFESGGEHPKRAAFVPTIAPTFAGAAWRVRF